MKTVAERRYLMTASIGNISAVSSSSQEMSPPCSAARHQDSITRMALAIVLVFGLCWLPVVIWALTWTFTAILKQHSNKVLVGIIYYTEYSGILTTVVNSSVNFIIYCLMGSTFRKTVCRILKFE